MKEKKKKKKKVVKIRAGQRIKWLAQIQKKKDGELSRFQPVRLYLRALKANQSVCLYVRPIDTGVESDYPLNKLLILEIILKFTEMKCMLKFNYKKLLIKQFCSVSTPFYARSNLSSIQQVDSVFWPSVDWTHKQTNRLTGLKQQLKQIPHEDTKHCALCQYDVPGQPPISCYPYL